MEQHAQRLAAPRRAQGRARLCCGTRRKTKPRASETRTWLTLEALREIGEAYCRHSRQQIADLGYGRLSL